MEEKKQSGATSKSAFLAYTVDYICSTNPKTLCVSINDFKVALEKLPHAHPAYVYQSVSLVFQMLYMPNAFFVG